MAAAMDDIGFPRSLSATAWLALRSAVDRTARHEPVRNAIHLALRFLGARAMSFVTLAIAAWFFDVKAFAEFGVYSSLVNLAWVAVFLRYESAIVAAEREPDAAAATRLCALVGLGMWAGFGAAAFAAFGTGLASGPLAACFAVALAERAVLRLAVMAATRTGDFRGLGRVALVQAVVQPVVLFALADALNDGALCLMVADGIGHGAAAVYFVWRQREFLLRSLGDVWSLDQVIATARAWAALPVLNLPGSLLALSFVISPLLIMPLVASPDFAGHVALVMRLFDVPTQIIGAAATPILLNRLRPSHDEPGAVFGRRMLVGLIGVTAAVYGTLAIGLAVLAPWLHGTILAGLAGVAPFVAVFQACIALAGPLGEACGLYREQGPLTLIHVAALVGCGLALAAAWTVAPMAGLVLLGLCALVRAVGIGERLRTLSIRSRDARLFACSTAPRAL